MSVKVMTLVWELDLPPGEKLVLLALADQANDNGVQCWPSLNTIAHKSGQNERTVRRAIRSLETKGHLTCHFRTGESTQYHVHPGHHAPPDKMPPRTNATKTPDTTPPKPSRTTIDEEWEARAREIRASPEWKAFAAMRRQIRKPLNPTAENRIFIKLRALAEDGYPPGAVLEQSTANCWRGVFRIDEEDDSDGRRTQRTNGMGRHQPANDGRSATTRAAERVFGVPFGPGDERRVPQ